MKNRLYTLTLLATESQFSCKAAELNLGKRWSHDTLHRSLQAPVSFNLNTLPEGDLVVDDVIVDKSYSQAIEGISTI